MWVVYDHPKDFPMSCVARRWDISADGPQPTDSTLEASSLDALRTALQMMNLICLPRDASDERQIVEVWL